MSITLAFDVYGTLIDTHGVVAKLQELVGNKAEEFSRIWREKQIEYSFRRGLMQNYETFAVCTSDALDYTCLYLAEPLTTEQKDELLGIYRVLPVFNDVKKGLIRLKAANHRLFAFSNGSQDALEMLLTTAGIRDLFLGVVSASDIKSFKPNPAVYGYFLRQSGATGSSAWLISSNPFLATQAWRVIGARSAGMKAAWVKRSQEAIFDPWGIEPTLTVESLADLAERITE